MEHAPFLIQVASENDCSEGMRLPDGVGYCEAGNHAHPSSDIWGMVLLSGGCTWSSCSEHEAECLGDVVPHAIAREGLDREQMLAGIDREYEGEQAARLRADVERYDVASATARLAPKFEHPIEFRLRRGKDMCDAAVWVGLYARDAPEFASDSEGSRLLMESAAMLAVSFPNFLPDEPFIVRPGDGAFMAAQFMHAHNLFVEHHVMAGAVSDPRACGSFTVTAGLPNE